MLQEKDGRISFPKHIDKNIRSAYNMRHKKGNKIKMPPIQTMLAASLGGDTYKIEKYKPFNISIIALLTIKSKS